MRRMGFDIRWIHLIIMCVTSARFEVLVNGVLCGNIMPTR
jgi:hypothetical protein